MSGLSVADVLDRAADLIEPEGAWGTGIYARDDHGFSVDAIDPDACSFCAMGAVYRAAKKSSRDDGPEVHRARKILVYLVGGGIAAWNDAPERTQAEVVAKLREAAALARSQEQAS